MLYISSPYSVCVSVFPYKIQSCPYFAGAYAGCKWSRPLPAGVLSHGILVAQGDRAVRGRIAYARGY